MRNQVILAKKVSELVTAFCVAENLSREIIAERLDFTRHQFNEQMCGRTRFWTETFEKLYSLFYKTQPQLAEKLLMEVFDGDLLVLVRPKRTGELKPELLRSDGLNIAQNIGILCGDINSSMEDNRLDKGEAKLLLRDTKKAMSKLVTLREQLEQVI